MAEVKKTTPRKKTVSKANTVTTVSTPSPAYKPASAASLGRTISAEERARMVQEAAYYRAERRGFQGDPHEDWVAAESEITSKLTRERIKTG